MGCGEVVGEGAAMGEGAAISGADSVAGAELALDGSGGSWWTKGDGGVAGRFANCCW